MLPKLRGFGVMNNGFVTDAKYLIELLENFRKVYGVEAETEWALARLIIELRKELEGNDD